MTKEEALKLINPPAHVPTELELYKARTEVAFEEEVSDLWFALHILIAKMKDSKEFLVELLKDDETRKVWGRAVNAEEHMTKIINRSAKEDWVEICCPNEDFKNWIDGLSEPHAGDCTALPCSCSRCLSEDRFGLKNTATWKNKEEGYKIYQKAYGE